MPKLFRNNWAIMLLSMFVLAGTSYAEIPKPHIVEPVDAESCVLPESEMRKNHMEYILHQRTETVHKGIRTEKYSFVGCINCHGVKDDAGDFVGIENEKHFCRSCHDYVAVNIDCFQCHADKPESAYATKPEALLSTDLIKKSSGGTYHE